MSSTRRRCSVKIFRGFWDSVFTKKLVGDLTPEELLEWIGFRVLLLWLAIKVADFLRGIL